MSSYCGGVAGVASVGSGPVLGALWLVGDTSVHIALRLSGLQAGSRLESLVADYCL
jgi:hypothetical protein